MIIKVKFKALENLDLKNSINLWRLLYLNEFLKVKLKNYFLSFLKIAFFNLEFLSVVSVVVSVLACEPSQTSVSPNSQPFL
ncbi:MAG: hypothetical protein PUB15_06150 [Ruminobacter sp.]|nr:hypothetical protein [Ruminobacter sp.]MDY5780066.1 hypothetical protein [Succinivibrionaceae bacterium]